MCDRCQAVVEGGLVPLMVGADALFALRRIDELSRRNERLRAELACATSGLDAARMMIHRDPLTGLPDRTLFADRLAQAVALAHRSGRPFAVLMLDVDRFKAINDRHGHAAGDRVLTEIARRLVSAVRSSDTVCRIGGDEFVVLLLDVRAGHRPASPIATALADLRVDGTDSPRVAVSIGEAVFPRDATTADALLAQADRAMYAQKPVSVIHHGPVAALRRLSRSIAAFFARPRDRRRTRGSSTLSS